MRLSACYITITSRSAGGICSGLHASAIWKALSRSGSSIHPARQREVVQDQESQLVTMSGARGIIRAGTRQRSQLALLERVCISK